MKQVDIVSNKTWNETGKYNRGENDTNFVQAATIRIWSTNMTRIKIKLKSWIASKEANT
jgi:hypothetical protein